MHLCMLHSKELTHVLLPTSCLHYNHSITYPQHASGNFTHLKNHQPDPNLQNRTKWIRCRLLTTLPRYKIENALRIVRVPLIWTAKATPPVCLSVPMTDQQIKHHPQHPKTGHKKTVAKKITTINVRKDSHHTYDRVDESFPSGIHLRFVYAQLPCHSQALCVGSCCPGLTWLET